MGNSSTKESRPSTLSRSRASSLRNQLSPSSTIPPTSSDRDAQPPQEGSNNVIYSFQSGSRSRPELSFMRLRSNSNTDNAAEPRRETKQEREARKLEKERQARFKERENSLKEEGVDGGFLVTLGTYTGSEDFSKATVRQLQIERRLAPFWKGLNEHQDSWTEHQLVAAVKGLAIPAADEIPLPEDLSPSEEQQETSKHSRPFRPQPSRFQASSADNLSSSSPLYPIPASSPPPSLASAFRGRSKTLASLNLPSWNSNSQTDLTPQEVQLPKDPYVNGQRTEAYLYKDAMECPICFLYYPLYLNKTRCCDQPICSECFVQIKRPDPHPPEHHEDPSNPNPQPRSPDEEDLLVSEPAACPFCVQPEFGVTYDPPPFRRGYAYVNQGNPNALARMTSAMSSSSSLASQGTPGATRRRATSLSANAPSVITTDRVRPDWAKKLSDARSHAARRSAAATALHTAAYLMGGINTSDSRGFGLGRRRRNLFTDGSPSASGQSSPRLPEGMSLATVNALLSAAQRRSVDSRGDGTAQGDLVSGRGSSRRSRVDDLEEIMMQSDSVWPQKKTGNAKKTKDTAKVAKKQEKQKAKELKKADKAAKKSGAATGSNDSAFKSSPASGTLPSPSEHTAEGSGKGKGIDRTGETAQPSPATMRGFNPLSEPTSTLNTEITNSTGPKPDSHHHPEQPRQLHPNDANHHSAYDPPQRSHLRQMSSASSPASSIIESAPESLRNGSIGGSAGWTSSFEASPAPSGLHIPLGTTPPTVALGSEPMLPFRSLDGIVDGGDDGGEIADVEAGLGHEGLREPMSAGRSRGGSGGSDLSRRTAPPEYEAQAQSGESTGAVVGQWRSVGVGGGGGVRGEGNQDDPDRIEAVVEARPALGGGAGRFDAKHFGDVRLLDEIGGRGRQEATQ